jgi:tagaturonate epimerase
MQEMLLGSTFLCGRTPVCYTKSLPNNLSDDCPAILETFFRWKLQRNQTDKETALTQPLLLPKYSLGMGDRFAHQAKAQLRACVLAADIGLPICPVWNKSNREHLIVGSEPSQTRAAADAAVKEVGWCGPYFLDADHINLTTYARFLSPCDFFTMDVAEHIGKPAFIDDIDRFIRKHPELIGTVAIPHIEEPFHTTEEFVRGVAHQFVAAVKDAARIYRAIAEAKGPGSFIPEISMDETDTPQTPVELLIILAAVADEAIPIQTIAPKFNGRFNKGVDYVGEVTQFKREFRDDIASIAFAVERYGLPANLKLSVHSGSDKYAIYGAINAGMREFNAGVHVKTAGTTWLEELIGLAEAGGNGLIIAKEIYFGAYAHAAELCAPYATVIDIDSNNLPTPAEVDTWTGERFARALRHDDMHDAVFNPDFRQLLHVGFKIAAKLGERYRNALEQNEELIARNVTNNLFERHIRPIFQGSPIIGNNQHRFRERDSEQTATEQV